MSTTDRFGTILSILILVLLALCFNNAISTDDDVYISYRFAKNMADGYGLVFNPHQTPVEGYTNFLWTVLIAGVTYVKLPIPATGSFLSFIFALLILVTMGFHSYRQREFTPGYIVGLPILLMAVSPSLALWATTGMETTFFTWLLLMGMIMISVEERHGKPGYLSGFFWAMAALTRPEGLFLGSIVILFSYLENPNRIARFGAFVQRILGFAIPVGTHFMFRRIYYGDWLPNTFYAKTVPSGDLIPLGMTYFNSFLTQGGLALYILMFLGVFVRPKISGIWTFLVTTLLYSAYTIWIGGDWMAAHRMYLPILPFMILGASAVITKFKLAYRGLGYILGLALFCHILVNGFLAQQPFTRGSTMFQLVFNEPEPVDLLKELGLELKRQTEQTLEQEVVAVIPAGKVPYYSGLITIDMRGLCDHHIARTTLGIDPSKSVAGHFKRDPEYVLKQEPDFIVLTGAQRKENIPLPPLDLRAGKITDRWTITENPEFIRCYKPVIVQLPQGDKNLFYYKRTCPKSGPS